MEGGAPADPDECCGGRGGGGVTRVSVECRML